MTVSPTGQTQPVTDQWGNPAYKSQVIDPARQLPDGDFYRVTRNAEGNEQNFRLRDGAAGQDFHIDPETGEQYVNTSGEDGASKRTVIGTDHFTPAANDMLALQQVHLANARAAGDAADQAEQGNAGAPGLGSLPLADLKTQRKTLGQTIGQAQDYIQSAQDYMAGGNTLNTAQLDAFRSSQAALSQYGPQAQSLDDEITGRDATITQARQQRSASVAVVRDVAGFRNILSTPQGQTQVKAALGTVLAGGDLDPKQAGRYVAAGLVQDDGSGGYALTDRGFGVLPKETQQQVAVDPDSYPLNDMAKQQVNALQATPPVKRAIWQKQQQVILGMFPQVAHPGSAANQTFIRAFRTAGSDPRKALQVARAVFGGTVSSH